MEQGKTKILSDLYAIRATMSLIAENDDSAEPEREAIEDLEKEERNAQYAISASEKKLNSMLSQKKKDAQKSMEKLPESIEELRKKRVWCKEDYESSKTEKHSFVYYLHWETLWGHRKFGCRLGIILLILIAVSVALGFALGHVWSLSWGYAYEDWTAYFLGVLATVASCSPATCVYLLVVCVPVAIKARKYFEVIVVEKRYALFQEVDAKLQEANRELNNATEIYEALSEGMDETTTSKHHCAEVNDLIQTHEKEVAELKKRRTELEQQLQKQKNPHNKAIQAIAKKSQALIDSATKTYPLIDFRDWEKVDLLIYYFETGRADDMKEALQLVDRQRQTEMLVDAIEIASEEICKTIHRSMNRLGNALAQSFSLLSSQMAKQHDELLRGLEEQMAAQKDASAAQLKEIRAQTAAQVTSQAMNRALLERFQSRA